MLDNDMQENFSKNIKKLLKERNMTYKEFADKLGYKPSTISMWMNGVNAPRMDAISKICDFFNINIEQLFLNPELSFKPTTLNVNNLLAGNPEQVIKRILDDNNELFLIEKYRSLNQTGKEEARKRVAELAEIKKYTEAD